MCPRLTKRRNKPYGRDRKHEFIQVKNFKFNSK